MDTFLHTVGTWFDSFGIPPMLGAFALGMLACYLFWGRRTIALASAGRIMPKADVTLARIDRAVDYDSKSIAVPGEVFTHLDNGDKISAIKALRSASGIELVDAKRIVDALAAKVRA